MGQLKYCLLSEHLLASFRLLLVREFAHLCLLFIELVRPQSPGRGYRGLFDVFLRGSHLLPPLCNVR